MGPPAMAACAVCARPATTRCSRCSIERYCGKGCQRRHWPEHRRLCAPPATPREAPRPAVGPPTKETCGFVDMRTPETHAPKAGLESTGGFRNITVPEPAAEHVLACCAYCAMLLKKTPADPGNGRDPDPLGVFWVDHPDPGNTCPADVLLAASPSTHTYLSHGRYVGACLRCARAAQTNEPAHRARCERWLRVGPEAPWHPMRRRERAAVLLHAAPDLTAGLGAAAGRVARGARAGASIPFGAPELEGLAFPALGATADCGWREADGDVRHHTFARLYSADGRWRRDPDFVAFAVHRAAAAGDAQFRAYAAAQLPAAVPASVLPGLPPSRALFLRFDDG